MHIHVHARIAGQPTRCPTTADTAASASCKRHVASNTPVDRAAASTYRAIIAATSTAPAYFVVFVIVFQRRCAEPDAWGHPVSSVSTRGEGASFSIDGATRWIRRYPTAARSSAGTGTDTGSADADIGSTSTPGGGVTAAGAGTAIYVHFRVCIPRLVVRPCCVVRDGEAKG